MESSPWMQKSENALFIVTVLWFIPLLQVIEVHNLFLSLIDSVYVDRLNDNFINPLDHELKSCGA